METLLSKAEYYYKKALNQEEKSSETVDSRDHDLHFKYQEVVNKGTPEAYAEL